jgi:hypothetical protein
MEIALIILVGGFGIGVGAILIALAYALYKAFKNS